MRDTYDSVRWQKASKETEAMVPRGIVSIRCGSTSAALGTAQTYVSVLLSRVSGWVSTVIPLVSLPVPHVVGTAMTGRAEGGTAIPK